MSGEMSCKLDSVPAICVSKACKQDVIVTVSKVIRGLTALEYIVLLIVPLK